MLIHLWKWLIYINNLIQISQKPKSKRQEEKAIFYDIFIKPKENKIKELTNKRNEQKLQIEAKPGAESKPSDDSSNKEKQKLFISNKITDLSKNKVIGNNNVSINTEATKKNAANNVSNKNITKDFNTKNNLTNNNLIKNTQNTVSAGLTNINETDFDKKFSEKNIFRINLSNYIKNDENYDPSENMLKYLKEKFIPISKESLEQASLKKNFFNQLIQIKPPEGINAVVASPLMDSKGWAPSIPSIQIDKTKTNLNDLMMRAKGGIQAGDIPKEAHMAFYLGLMNEEEKKYEEALKFYKKYFLSAKLLQDIYGTELALNRIAVIYSNLIDFSNNYFIFSFQ